MRISFSTYSSFLHLLLLVGLFSACEKKNSIPQLNPVPVDAGIYVCHEGNFQWGNADFGRYQNSTKQFFPNLFSHRNQQAIGDVLQSMVIYNGHAYFVVNNSGVIIRVDPNSYEQSGEISGLKSPRYLLPINESKAYVSDLYADKIWIVDLYNLGIMGSIPCNGWTEEMLLLNDKAFVCNRESPYVYVINTLNDKIIDSLAIGFGSTSICKDAGNNVWVMSIGNDSIDPRISCINANSNSISKSITLTDKSEPGRMVCNTTRDRLYWIQNGVWTIAVSALQAPSAPLCKLPVSVYYGIGFYYAAYSILVSDAKDFVQQSDVYVIDTTGNTTHTFKSGINTSFFYNPE